MLGLLLLALLLSALGYLFRNELGLAGKASTDNKQGNQNQTPANGTQPDTTKTPAAPETPAGPTPTPSNENPDTRPET